MGYPKKTHNQTAVVFASNRGSNFEAIVKAIKKKKIPSLSIIHFFCSKKDAPAFDIAKKYSIPYTYLPLDIKKDKKNLSQYTEKIKDEWKKTFLQLKNLKPDWIFLCGFMKIIPNEIIHAWKFKILNIHPSLLPSFIGIHAQQQALNYGVTITGCTVHLVTEKLDGGPVILQKALSIREGEDLKSLEQRLLKIEHLAYIEAIKKITQSPFCVENNRIIWL